MNFCRSRDNIRPTFVGEDNRTFGVLSQQGHPMSSCVDQLFRQARSIKADDKKKHFHRDGKVRTIPSEIQPV
jgi:hypothetical protein